MSTTKKRDTRDRSEYQRKRREMFPEMFAERHRKWRKANPEKHNANTRKWALENKEWVRDYQRKWREQNKEKLKEQRKLRYEANPQKERDKQARYRDKYYEQHKQKWLEYGRKQRGLPPPTRPCPDVCEMCGNPPQANIALHLDHDHDNGAFRGWLCRGCNAGLGSIGDDKAGVLRALAYLERYEAELRLADNKE